VDLDQREIAALPSACSLSYHRRMFPTRSHSLATETTDEPTPQPASTVGAIASTERPPAPSPASAERRAVLLEYFANPSPEMRQMDTAWEEALALYGDEDSDAWVAALEDGTHPLCRIGTLARPA
jgi:hypothetical protein